MTVSQQQNTAVVVAPYEYTDPGCPQRARYPITPDHTVTVAGQDANGPEPGIPGIAEARTLLAILGEAGPLTVAALTERAAPLMLAEEIRTAAALGRPFDPANIIHPLVGELEYARLVTVTPSGAPLSGGGGV
ncbi:hypothetical protein CLV63_11287 [Murinocardiopsis flavida]|uniref:Uncharacterized protein n=1 Tax=Murinocardiopsis flavida TaxID=645275 RepID=A0A2P8DG58_9ACTN|nr:hypothetical protein [Murinocardiopsis flavida]PSK96205.1 hypothetical protein CLV63_11287 [Murinocardiopsis flavida]